MVVRRLLACAFALACLISASASARADDASRELPGTVSFLQARDIPDSDLDLLAEQLVALVAAGAAEPVMREMADRIDFLLRVRPANSLVPAGTLARCLLALDAAGRDVRRAGNRDLVTDLTSTMGTGPAAPGQFPARAGHEIATQSWAILALSRVRAVPPDAGRFLASRQCTSGVVVADPSVSACQRGISHADQGLALAAFSAMRNDPTMRAKAEHVIDWFLLGRASGQWSTLTSSGLGWAASPLGAMGRGDLAAEVRAVLISRRVAPSEATLPAQAGSLAETAQQRDELLTQGLLPTIQATVAAVIAWSGTEVSTLTYQPRAGVPDGRRGARVSASVAWVNPSDSVSYLLQGFAPHEQIVVTVAGLSTVRMEGGADEIGSLQLRLSATEMQPGSWRVVFESASGRRVESPLTVVGKKAPDAGPAAVSGGATVGELRLPIWEPWSLALAMACVLLAGALVARLLRSSRKNGTV